MANFTELFNVRLTDCGKWSRYFTFSCRVISSSCLCFLRHRLICVCRQERVYNPRNDHVKRSLPASSSSRLCDTSDVSLWSRRNRRRFPQSSGPGSWFWVHSCELFDGWLSSDSKNTLSPASKAKGTRLCVSVKGGRASSYSPHRDLEMLRGVTRGDGPRLTGGPQLRGWRSIRSKCPPSRSFHCSMPPPLCFVGCRRTSSDPGHIILTPYHSQ